MKKNIILIILSLFILSGIAGYIYFEYFYKQEEIEVMSLVPENTIAVYEIKNSVNKYNNLQEKGLWSSLKMLPAFMEIDRTLIELDSITGKEGNLDKVFRDIPLCISLHQTSKESFGFIFYFQLKDLMSYDVLNKVLVDYQKKKKLNIDTRTYLGEKITEISDVSSNNTFSYIIYKDHFAGSFYPVLLEDVIRNIESANTSTFKTKNQSLFNIKGAKGNDENLYINGEKLNALFSVFSSGGKANTAFASFSESSLLNLEAQDKEIFLNGYTLAGNGNDDYYISTFKGQRPGKLLMSNWVPNRTSTFFHITFHDGPSWHDNLTSFWHKKNPAQEKKQQQFFQKFGIQASNIFQWMEGEIGMATLQSMDVEKPDKLVFIKSNDIHETFNQMNKLAAKAEVYSGDSLFVENFSDTDIRQLNIEEFPSILMGDQFSGFPTCFFSAIEDYIIIGNSLQVMKSTIADIEADNVWGKSVAMNQYFENSLGDANLSYIINTQRIWNSFIHHLNENWKPFFTKNNVVLKNFDVISMQFSENGNKFYTSINLKHQEASKKGKEVQSFNLATKISVDAPIITKPFYVKNPGEKTMSVLFQDSLFNLYKVSLNGEVLWKDSIGEQIVGNIQQIDYLKNGQLQYVFSTSHAIHVLSKEGSYINNNFPHHFDEPIAFMSVVDYDNSKNYRFLVASTKGQLYMFDKQMEVLEGWNPKDLQSKPATAPIHIRVRGKDFLISLQENGELNVMSRRGEMYPGFPLNLQGKFDNNFFIQPGPTFSQTILTTISQRGEIIRLNLEGKILKREQLYRPSRETRFILCIDEFQKNYIIARQQLGILTLLDPKGEVILEKDYITSGALEIQYFNAGIEKEVYAVTDKIQEFTYLYDYKGNLINSRPIDSGHKVALNYAEASGDYEVIANFNNQFSKIGFTR